MARLACVPVEAWHVEHVAAHMRSADRREVCELGDMTPREALDMSLGNDGSRWTLLIDEVPAAIFGVIPVTVMGDTAIGWFLGTPLLDRHPKAVMRGSRVVLRDVLAHYGTVMNQVSIYNAGAIRWLRELGAEFAQSGNVLWFWLKAK